MTDSADTPSRPRVSVAMIVRDEQEVLGASIESVRPIADEIVVLDTGSKDQSVAVARQLGAVVEQAPFGQDFGAARNRCLEHVSGDWVLWLDAGERLQKESAAELRQFIDHEADPSKGYLVLVQAPPVEPSASGEQVAQLRLMPRRSDVRFEGRVRETARPSLEAAGLEISAAPGRIVRHPRHNDPARKMRLARRNLDLAARPMSDGGGLSSARAQLAMGEARGELGDQAEARRAFLQAIEEAEHGSTEMLEAYYGLLATYYADRLFGQLQLTACLEALEIYPLDAQLLLVMGNHLSSNDRVDLAVRCFDTAVKYGQVNPETWHLSELAEVAADCLHATLQIQGKGEEAAGVLEEALQRNPSSIRLRRRLIDLHLKHGRTEEALGLAGQLPMTVDHRESLRDAIRGAGKAAQKDWLPALAYLQSAYVAGCRDPLCLRWLSVTLLSNGQIEAARPVLREWQQVDPGNVEMERYLAALEPRAEVATAEQPRAAVPSSCETVGQHLRIDPGTTVLEVAPPILPIVSQATSADAIGPSE